MRARGELSSPKLLVKCVDCGFTTNRVYRPGDEREPGEPAFGACRKCGGVLARHVPSRYVRSQS